MGRYRLVRRLASGGMAEVFLARADGPMGFEKQLVVKRILPHLAESPRFIEMFLAEAKLAAQLNHPNIVQIFDFGDEKGTYFIAMEYVEGLNLRTLSRRATNKGTPIPFPLIARMASSVCEGLVYAHEWVEPRSGQPLRLIHRDISPDNILISRAGGVKVADFGIAKANNGGPQTRIGVIKGKVSYLAPEYLKGQPIDLRVDVYGLGVVLFELLAGRRPFQASSEDQLLHLVAHQPAPDVRTVRPEVPEALARIVEQALATDPERRYPGCRPMQADLERYLLSCGDPAGALQLAEWVKELSQDEPEPAPWPEPPSTQPSPSPGIGVGPSLEEEEGVEATVPARPKPQVAAVPQPARPPEVRRRPKPWGLAAGAALVLGLGGLALTQLQSEPSAAPPMGLVMPSPAASAVVPSPPAEAVALSPPELLPESAQDEAAPARKAGTLTVKSVTEVVRKSGAAITACGDRFRDKLPADGRLMAVVRVGNSGAVSEVKVEPAVLSPALRECVAQQIGQLEFPANSNEPELVLKLPLRFE